MKNLILIVLFSVSAIVASSQEVSRIDEIDGEIEIAVENGNYEKAANLKREKEIRMEIDEAVKNGDYDTAARLKEELNSIPGANTGLIKKKQAELDIAVKNGDYDLAATLKQEIEALENGTPLAKEEPKEVTNEPDPETKGVIESIPVEAPSIISSKDYLFKNGFNLDFIVNSGFGDYLLVGGGFQLGNKWYFGGRDKSRTGLLISWSRVTFNYDFDYSDFQMYIAPINAGLATISKFSDNTGLESNVVLGFAMLPLDDEFGFNVGLEYKFRYKALAVGVDYRFYVSPYSKLHMPALTMGFKF